MQRGKHRKAMCRRKNQLGLTLVHMLAYVTILAVVINICAALFVAVLRMHDAGSNALDQSQTLRHVEAELREVVSGAVAVRPEVGEHRTSNSAVVLEFPPEAETGAARYAVFRKLANVNDGVALQRLELRGEQLKVVYLKTYNPAFGAIEFGRGDETGPARAVTVRLTPVDDGNPQREPREQVITVALGGLGGAS